MPLSTFKKHFARGNQFLSEKLGGVKGTDKGEEYRHLTQLIDSYKAYYENVQKRVIDCLEPNPNARKRAWANSTVNKIQGTSSNETYPHAEKALSECFLEYGRQLSQQQNFSLALIRCGEAYSRIVDSKNQSLDETKTGYLKPISETLNQDIREITMLRKKVENKRLTFDHRKHVLEKTNSQPDEAFEEAKCQFEESLTISSKAMSNFLDGEVEQIEALSNLVTAQLSFYQDAVRILSDLQGELQTRHDQAKRHVPYPVSPKQGFTDLPTFDSGSTNFQIKPKYENQSKQTPTCVALYDFDAESPFELSFHEGEEIKLIEQVDENWYLGELRDKKVIFQPIMFVFYARYREIYFSQSSLLVYWCFFPVYTHLSLYSANYFSNTTVKEFVPFMLLL
ncbi:unnamed protein product [Heterobilharzia americana]|nr:unnamed protein product [Heterobilharzia americana]